MEWSYHALKYFWSNILFFFLGYLRRDTFAHPFLFLAPLFFFFFDIISVVACVNAHVQRISFVWGSLLTALAFLRL